MGIVAVIYARYSTERQSESSIADQINVCRGYAHRQGWELAGAPFVDEGISGASFGNRPGAQALEQFALQGGCQVILVTDLTRLSRSSGDLSKFIDRMRFRKVRIVGVQDGYDSTSRTARMQAGLSGIMSEEFRAMIADRTRSALSIRAEAGQSTGGRAYGYRDGETEIVREVFARFANGQTMKEIVSDLNRRGVPSPGSSWKRTTRAKHGRWLVSALHALLQNERYIGRLIWNRSQALKEMRAAAREMQPSVDPQVAELERLVREGILSREIAAPALAEAKRRAQPVVTPIPSERLWRETVASMREVLQGDDVAAAREILR